jgi:hypothetical protein
MMDESSSQARQHGGHRVGQLGWTTEAAEQTKRSLVLIAAAALVVLTLAVPTRCYAYGSMAYGYGYDFMYVPFYATYGDLSYIPGDTAGYWVSSGYSKRTYTSAWSSAIQANLGSSALGSMCIWSHGAAAEANGGEIINISTVPSSDGKYVSILASNYTYPLNGSVVGGFRVDVPGETAGDGDQGLGESRALSDIPDMSATKLVLYQGCRTGADPAMGSDMTIVYGSTPKNLLYYTIAPRDDLSKGAGIAIGFQGNIGANSTDRLAGDHAMNYWGTRLFYYLSGSWKPTDAMYWATHDLDNQSYQEYGFSTHYYRGNGSLLYPR